MKNFKDVKYDDYDCLTKVRVFYGRITPKRVEIISSFIERFNEQNRYPYGQGYSCGHIHDCCGCLVSTYMTIKIGKKKIKIYWNETFNY
jgi:hypothetical protein